MMEQIILTILMPCLNEAESLAFCIREAQQFVSESEITAEILVVDNGSEDDSVAIASELGARVVVEEQKGYGQAIRTGIREAKGTYVIMGDSDGSYDFYHLQPFVEQLKAGYSLVVGNRFAKQMEKGAMPYLHRYFGVPLLSVLARKCFHITEIHDFHCGQRGFVREVASCLSFTTTGMEFATEMIVEFALSGGSICEIPVVLRKDKRSGASHLRTFRDGWRHLKYIVRKRVKNRNVKKGHD